MQMLAVFWFSEKKLLHLIGSIIINQELYSRWKCGWGCHGGIHCARASCHFCIHMACPLCFTLMDLTVGATASTLGVPPVSLLNHGELYVWNEVYECKDPSSQLFKQAVCMLTWGAVLVCREVKSVIGRGKGIPHALRAFARVLCATSTHGEYSYNCWHWYALFF
jgi:hypothetical protein